MSTLNTPILSIEHLSVGFPSEEGLQLAVNQLNLVLAKGEILGLVGESGCGKSMTALAVLGLVPRPGKIVSGTIRFEGQDLTKLTLEQLRRIRGAKIAIIPQDPLTSLNPVYTIGNQLSEVLMLHQGLSQSAALAKAIEMLNMVQMPNAKERIHDYPHQFSGGMRQRVMIAMALCCNPAVLIADEPTTALDVTVQAQILRLMNELQREFNMAILLITHDLGVVAEMCHRVAVMYAGRLVEEASVNELFDSPKHPYTQGLLASLPVKDKKRLKPIEGQPPLLHEIPIGCSFEPRCAHRMAICTTAFPEETVISDSHRTCCYLYQQSASPVN